MNGGATPQAGQLNAVDEAHAQPLGCGTGFVQAVQGVVIGQGQQAHAAGMGARHHIGGREYAVGSSAVAVQVDLQEAAFAFSHVCYYAASSRAWLPL